MTHAQNDPPRAGLGSSLPVLLLLAVVVGLLATSAARIALRARAIRGEEQALAERLQVLEKEKERLQESIRAAGTAEGVERLAKEFLNLKWPAEEVVIVSPEGQQQVASVQPQGAWARVRDAFLRMWGR